MKQKAVHYREKLSNQGKVKLIVCHLARPL